MHMPVSDVFWIYEPRSTRFLYVSPAYELAWMRSAAALYADAKAWLDPPLAPIRLAAGLLARQHLDGPALELRAICVDSPTVPAGAPLELVWMSASRRPEEA